MTQYASVKDEIDYDALPEETRVLVERVLFARAEDAAERYKAQLHNEWDREHRAQIMDVEEREVNCEMIETENNRLRDKLADAKRILVEVPMVKSLINVLFDSILRLDL